jgi:hypothetical protein
MISSQLFSHRPAWALVRPVLFALAAELALAALLAAPRLQAASDLPVAYDLPSLPENPRNKPFRSRAEVSAAGRLVLEKYVDHAAAAAGFLDVTKAPYLARGDGVSDDTAALQRALDDARDARLVVWLPAGTYLVRDALQCVEGAIEWRVSADVSQNLDASSVGQLPGAEDRLTAADHPCVIAGPAGPERAVIRLAPDAKGFEDPARPRPVIFLWARRWTPPHDYQPGVSFNQMLSGVDFDNSGHAGAIAVDIQGAQGTVVQDVHIEADGALAGLRGLTGSGGSTQDIIVRGGRFGVLAAGIGEYARHGGSQPAPLLVGATFIGQTEASLFYAGRGPLTVIGAKIQGRGIVCAAEGPDYNGALNLLDSSLDVTDGEAITANRPVYLANTFVRGAKTLVRFSDGQFQPVASDGWQQVREFAGAPVGPFPIWIDGRKQTAFVADLAKSPAAPPADLQARHALPELPAWNAPGVANACAAPYHATGDNTTDDAPAIQRALDEHSMVFLPKGRYRLGRPLVLAPGRKLFGAGRTFTVLVAGREAPAFAKAADPQPLIDTVDAPAADTTIALLELQVTRAGAYALRWRAGAHSVVRDVNFHRTGVPEASGSHILIEGGGGGRWYNFFDDEQTHGSAEYRHLLVRGTRQPLVFYMFNPEHARGDVMVEFVDVRDVTIYSLKGETYEIGKPSSGTRPLLRVRDSQGFHVYGGGGICGASAGYPPWVYRFENSSDVVVTNLGHQGAKRFGDPATWSMISDVAGDRQTATPGNEFLTLYRTK